MRLNKIRFYFCFLVTFLLIVPVLSHAEPVTNLYPNLSPGKFAVYDFGFSYNSSIRSPIYNNSRNYTGNDTINASINSISAMNGHEYLNVAYSIKGENQSVLPYVGINVTSVPPLLQFMIPGPILPLWPQLNNTTLSELRGSTYGTNVTNVFVPAYGRSINVTATTSFVGETTTRVDGKLERAYELKITEDYSGEGNYSNLTSRAFIDEGTGLITGGSLSALQTFSLKAFNHTIPKANFTYQWIMSLVKTNFNLSYNHEFRYQYAVILIVAVAIITGGAAIFIRQRNRRK